MDRLVITIHPTPSDEGLLRVSDAMEQVIDALRVFEQAERVLVSPEEYFEWRLERASAGSPFTVVAVAEPLDATKDVTPYILRVKSEVSHGIRNFISHGIPPRWMDPEGMAAFRRLLSRNQNGIGRTDIDFDVGPNTHDVVSIDREKAEAGIRAIAALNIMDLADDLKFPAVPISVRRQEASHAIPKSRLSFVKDLADLGMRFQKFRETARALECNESGAAFNRALKKVAKAPPPPKESKSQPKKPGR